MKSRRKGGSLVWKSDELQEWKAKVRSQGLPGDMSLNGGGEGKKLCKQIKKDYWTSTRSQLRDESETWYDWKGEIGQMKKYKIVSRVEKKGRVLRRRVIKDVTYSLSR